MALRNRIILGELDSGAEVLQISKEGVDILAASGANDYSFNSTWQRSGLIHQAGQVDGYGSVVAFPALSFIPFVILRRWDGVGTVYGDEQFTIPMVPGIFPTSVHTAYWAKVTSSSFSVEGNPATYGASPYPPGPYKYFYVVFRLPCIGLA